MEYEHHYELVTMMLAPEGSYFELGPAVSFLLPAMYIGVWKDENGMIYETPLAEGTFQSIDDWPDIQEYLNKYIPRRKRLHRCLICRDIVHYVGVIRKQGGNIGKAKESIKMFLENIQYHVAAKEIKATPEAEDFLRNGDWDKFITMRNDGTLVDDWKKIYLDKGYMPLAEDPWLL